MLFMIQLIYIIYYSYIQGHQSKNKSGKVQSGGMPHIPQSLHEIAHFDMLFGNWR